MAANEGVIEESCISDPNFAIICSFFENFSALCGIKRPTISELQAMVDSTEEITPQLADLHIRMMRKAKKNVNPDRWQRTLAKFCYYNLPDDCWELEQKGYKHLHYSQRLRILLVLIGAQFDHNTKFKTDVNKLMVDDLRLSPFGTDKDGNNYWLHTDEDLNLKVYKEDLDEEKWELIVSDREGLETLIKELIKEKDPNRKLDEIEDDDEDDDEAEEEQLENEDSKVKEESSGDEQENVKKNNIKNVKLIEYGKTETEKYSNPKIEKVKGSDPKTEDVKKPNPNVKDAKESDHKIENSKEVDALNQITKDAADPKIENLKEIDPNIKGSKKADYKIENLKQVDAGTQISKEADSEIENVKEPDPKMKDVRESDHQTENSEKVGAKTKISKETDHKNENVNLPNRKNEVASEKSIENPCPNKTGNPYLESNILPNVDTVIAVPHNIANNSKQDLKHKPSADFSTKADAIELWDRTYSTKQPLGLMFKKKSPYIPTPPKPLDKESFTSHLKILDSNDILRPLLNTEIVPDPISGMSEALKSKLGVKVQPKLVDTIDVKKTTDMLLSKVKKMDSQPAVSKITKPGLKLEQILKSKLAQKLASSISTVEVKSVEFSEPLTPSNHPCCSTQGEHEKEKYASEPTNEPAANQTVPETASSTEGPSKRKLSDCGENEETKKARIEPRAEEEEEEIEEPIMLVTGTGNGRECDTGNNKTEPEKAEQNAPTSTTNTGPLTHKVEDILKNSECDQTVDTMSTSADEVAHDFSISCVAATTVADVEKKKPKLWTIDAICSSDSKPSDANKNRYDHVMQFPNYSFNKEAKKSNENPSSSSGYQNAAESYSIFNLSSDSAKDDHAMSAIPTNFYFGNNQNPCFLPAERHSNSYKPTTPNKSHNVKDIVENLEAKDHRIDIAKVTNFNVENLYAKEHERQSEMMKEEAFNLCVRKVDSSIEVVKPVEKFINTVEVSEKVENQQQALNLCSSDALQRPGIVTKMADKPVNEAVIEEQICESGEAKVERVVDDAVVVPEQAMSVHVSETVIFNNLDNPVEENVIETVDETNKRTADEDENPCDTANQSEDCFESKLDDKQLQCQDTSPVESFINVDISEMEHRETRNESITDVKTEITSVDAHFHSKVPSPQISSVIADVLTHFSGPNQEKDTQESDISGDLANKPEKKIPQPTCSDVVDGDTFVREKLKSTEVLDSGTGESTQLVVSKMIKDTEVNLELSSVIAKYPKTDAKEPKEQITSVETQLKGEEKAVVNYQQEFVKSETETVEDLLQLEDEHKTTNEKPRTKTPSPSPALRLSTRLSRSARDINAKPDEQLPSSSAITIAKESEKDTKMPKKGMLKNKAANEEETETAIEEESDSLVRGSKDKQNKKSESKENENDNATSEQSPKKDKGRTLNDENEQEETVEKKPLRKGRSAMLKSVVNEPEETVETKSSRISRSQTQKNDVGEETSEIKSSKKGKNQTSKADVVKEQNEIVEARPLRKGRSQTQKNDPIEQEKTVETKSSKKSKSPAVKTDETKHEGSSRTSRSRTQRNDANELEDKIETKLPKKGKNKVPKNDENKREETVEVKTVRSGRGRIAKSDEVEQDDATEAKPVRKGRSRTKDEDGENEETVKTKCENETPEDSAKSKTGMSADEDRTPIDENVSNETGVPINKDEVGCSNDDVPLTSRRQKTIKKAKKKKKSAKTKVETVGSGEEKESANIDNDLENDRENKKETKSKKHAESKDDIENEASETLENSQTLGEGSSNKTPAGKKKRRGWLNEVDVSNIAHESAGIRQSRRIAQLKIKEQSEVKYVDPVTTPKKSTPQKSKPITSTKKTANKTPTKKSSKYKPFKEDSDEGSAYEKSAPPSKKKKKKKDTKKNFDVNNAWKASSGTSSEEEEPEEEDHFEDDEELVINDRSDHEFSPESDIDDDEDYTPVKRARTAHSKPATEDKPERDDLSCQSCGTADQPEWILLCDMCDEGWHAACLKPPVLSIPEGNWYCPPCQHNKLITNLQKFMKTYDKNVKKRANEELRKKRLEYVGISFSNIIIENDKKAETKVAKSIASDDYSEEEESEDEPQYQLRVRRQANVSHRLSEYEELMNSAIQRDCILEITNENIMDDVAVPHTEFQNGGENSTKEFADRGELPVDDEKAKNEDDSDKSDTEVTENQGKVSPVVLQLRGIRRKPPRLTNLDVSSEEDHFSDEDFKGSSDDQDDDDEYGKSESESDEGVYRKGREPVRRSTRARVTRYDNEFINDESEDEEDIARKKKKRRTRYSDSDSEQEDSTWGKRKKSKTQGYRPSKKKRRRITFDGDSEEERKKTVKKPRVKYGLDESEEDYPQRKTRGKRVSYLENLDSDSEEDISRARRNAKKVISDDEEYMDDNENEERDTSKESVVDENGKRVESGSDIDLPTDKEKTCKIPNELHNSESKPEKLMFPVSSTPQKNQPLANSTSTEIEEITILKTSDHLQDKENAIDAVDQHPAEPAYTNNANKKKKNGKSPKKDVHMYSGIVKDDNKLVLKKVDANPSLEGLQSMAQSLSQNMNSSSPSTKYPISGMHDSKYPSLTPTNSPGTTHVNFADVGISYEKPEGTSMNDDKFAPPLRVVSPSKLYSMQEGQPVNRPPPPFAVGPRMRPPHMLGATVNQMMMPMRVPMPMQGPPLQGSPMQRPPNQGPLMQRPPIQGPSMQGPPMQGLPMQRLNAPPHGPPPNVNLSPSGPTAGTNTAPAESVSRRGRRGRGKKQLEMERLEREREAMEAANRTDEMMPLHMLKIPTSEMNVARPPVPYPNPPGPSQFPGYPPNVQRMSFSQASPMPPHSSPSSTMGGNSSKRVKITPTRMRMPGSQNSARFPRLPGASVMYTSHPHDPSPSGGGAIITNDNKPRPVPGNTAVATTLSVKTETQVSAASVKMESPDQYYHPTSYALSQIPRGYNQRPPEFSFVRNPLPPMYRQQLVSPGAPTSTSFSRPPYVNTPSVITGGPPSSLPAPVNTSPSAKTEVTSAPSQVSPHSYSSPYSQTQTTSSTSSPVSVKPNLTTTSYTTPTHTTQSAPPTSSAPPITAPYQMLHTKQLPTATQQSSSPTAPYEPPYYTSSMMPNSYPPQPPPSQLPPVSSFGPNAPVSYANQPGSRVQTPLPASQQQQPPLSSSSTAPSAPYKPQPVLQVDTSTNSNSAEYFVPTSQSNGNEFQFSGAPQSVPTSETECSQETEYEDSYNQSSTYEEEKQTNEEPASGGEFGGLVSYFSSQHEDDLDS